MYWIIAADGQRYGPADLPTLRQWCQEGRITPDTSVIDPIDNVPKSARNIPEIVGYIRVSGPPVQTPTHDPSAYNPGAYMHGMQQPDYSKLPSQYQANYPRAYASEPKSKVGAALMAFFLGFLGVHRFYMGHTGTGLAMLLITVLTCGYGSFITGIWALVDFILILTDALPDSEGRKLV